MADLAAEVTAAIGRSIVPSVIARGAAIRVAAVGEDGVVSLEVSGSPGAVLPVLSRIEAQLRAAVPGVTAVRLAAADPDPAPPSPGAGDLGPAAQRILDAEVNPATAAHRGHVTVDSVGDGWVRIRLEGGCQGCSLAEVTLRQGIEPLLRARLPGLAGVADVTDHRPVLLPGETLTSGRRVLLLAPARSYRTADFMLAATRMGLDLIVASDGALVLAGRPVIAVRPATRTAPPGRSPPAAGQWTPSSPRTRRCSCSPPRSRPASDCRTTRPARCWQRPTRPGSASCGPLRAWPSPGT